MAKKLADDYCARCHAIELAGTSPRDLAPAFRELTQRYPVDTLGEALAEGIVTGHPDMPEFIRWCPCCIWRISVEVSRPPTQARFMAMKTTPFQREWIEISVHLGLDIQLSYEIDLGDRKLTVPVLLRGFGANNGMLLLTDYDLIRDVAEEVVNRGYGFLCLRAQPETN